MQKDFIQAVKDRRTFYEINDEKIVPDYKIQSIVETALKHAPSAFNSQSTRIVLLMNEEHKKLWNITEAALEKIMPAENFKMTKEKIESFAAGSGTILFFEDKNVIQMLQDNFPPYKDNFPNWSEQTSAIHQYIIWTALEIEGYGASLQHYSAIIESPVKVKWGLPISWELIGQMPFGKPTSQPGEKSFQSIEDRLRIFK